MIKEYHGLKSIEEFSLWTKFLFYFIEYLSFDLIAFLFVINVDERLFSKYLQDIAIS